MIQRIGFGLLWLSFIGYAFFLAPPNSPDTLELIQKLSLGQWAGINPLIVALFNIMGIWPMIYACLLLSDGRNQTVPAWPFVMGSFGLGAFTLLPYLALRQPNPHFSGKPDRWIRLVDSRITGAFLTIAALMLLIYGLVGGNWSNFIQQWQTSRFVHVMSLDFCLLCLLFPALLGDDMARRNLGRDRRLFWAISLLPLIGSALYLAFRPSLQPETAEVRSRDVEPESIA